MKKIIFALIMLFSLLSIGCGDNTSLPPDDENSSSSSTSHENKYSFQIPLPETHETSSQIYEQNTYQTRVYNDSESRYIEIIYKASENLSGNYDYPIIAVCNSADDSVIAKVEKSDLGIEAENITFMTNFRFFSDDIIGFWTTDNQQSSYNQSYIYDINANTLIYSPVGIFDIVEFSDSRRLYLGRSPEDVQLSLESGLPQIAHSDVYLDSRFVAIADGELHEQILAESTNIHIGNVAFTENYNYLVVLHRDSLSVDIYKIEGTLILIQSYSLDTDIFDFSENDFEWMRDYTTDFTVELSPDKNSITLEFDAEDTLET